MQFVVNGLVTGAAYALVALSFSVVFRVGRFFNFTHAAVFTWAGYFGYLCWTILGLSLWAGALLSVCLSAVLGVLLELSVYMPLHRRRASGVVLLLVSLGLYTIMQNTISMLFGDEIKRLSGNTVAEGLSVWGARATRIQLAIVIICVVVFVAFGILLRLSPFGTRLRAVADDPDLAAIQGVQVHRFRLAASALGSGLAAVVSLLMGLDVGITPTVGLNALMMGVVAVIAGGVDSTPGIFLGGILLGLAQHLGVWKIGTQWQDAIAFAVLILFLVLRPQGFFGKPLRKAAV